MLDVFSAGRLFLFWFPVGHLPAHCLRRAVCPGHLAGFISIALRQTGGMAPARFRGIRSPMRRLMCSPPATALRSSGGASATEVFLREDRATSQTPSA